MKKYFLAFCLLAPMASAQYFSNNAFQLPTIGWMGFDSTASALTSTPWPTTDQLQLGLGYQYALMGYDLWWVTQSAISLGYARNYGTFLNTQVLASVNALTGLRYNFATEAWRPFVMGGVGLFSIFSNPNSTSVTKNWMTVQLGPGLEWFFADEMSFQLETGAMVFFNFQNPPSFTYCAKLSYLFYF